MSQASLIGFFMSFIARLSVFRSQAFFLEVLLGHGHLSKKRFQATSIFLRGAFTPQASISEALLK
jgi:hypothetical protein